MTNSWTDIKNTDLVVIMGGNAAEAHPCGFKWVTEAKASRGAKLIVVDPRFTRSASVADFYCPIRQGTDIAFLMGLIGSAQLAAHAIALQIASISFMIPLGLAQAATVRVGLAFGRRDKAGIGRAGWAAFALGGSFMALMALTMLSFPHQLVLT